MPRRPGPASLHRYSLIAEWDHEAACLGLPHASFFPIHSRSKAAKRAVAVCRTCPVMDKCREFALDNRIEWGVWGGMTEADRRRELKRRRHG